MDESNSCLFCLESLEYRVLLPCNHNSMCLKCYIRDKMCYQHSNCLACQKPIDSLPIISTDRSIVTYSEGKSRNPTFNPQYQIYLLDSDRTLAYISSLFRYNCSACSLTFTAFDVFASHLKAHKMRACQICCASNRFLPGDLTIFKNNSEYQQHFHSQHPRCPCCSNYYAFDCEQLEKHMFAKHVRCEICASNNKISWFADTAKLIEHHQKCHFVCPHSECTINGLIAFATEKELWCHLESVHHEKPPMNSSSTQEAKNSSEEVENYNREKKLSLNKKFMDDLAQFIGVQKRTDLMNFAREYIKNRVTADVFYSKFCEFLGSNKDAVFTDMIALMPNKNKRLELLKIHQNISSQPVQQEQASNASQSDNVEQQETQMSTTIQESKFTEKTTPQLRDVQQQQQRQQIQQQQEIPQQNPPQQTRKSRKGKKKIPSKVILSF